MIDSGIESFPARLHEWLKEQNADSSSPIFGDYKTIEESEECPSPADIKNRRSFFNGLVSVFGSWSIDPKDDGQSCEQVNSIITMELMAFRLLRAGEKVGVEIRKLAGRTNSLFIQERFFYSPKGADPTKNLWRPSDTASTGITIAEIKPGPDRLKISKPADVLNGVRIEVASIPIVIKLKSRDV